jgi:hypothetical protein
MPTLAVESVLLAIAPVPLILINLTSSHSLLGTSSPINPSTMQQSTPNGNGKPSEGSSSSISSAPQINGFGQMSSSSTTPAQGQAQGHGGQGGGLGTMAEQQKRAHLYVGNLSPRVNEQSEFFSEMRLMRGSGGECFWDVMRER